MEEINNQVINTKDILNSTIADEILALKRSRESNKDLEAGTVAGMSGYAELFESADGKPLESGYFVTLEGRQVRKVFSGDTFILGVTTHAPAVLGNGNDLRWKNKYKTDPWGKILHEENLTPEVKDINGNVIIPEHKEKHPMVNPKWDREKVYIPRIFRPEWVPVALIGQILVRDDGSCKVNGYCAANAEGIATEAELGYRVLERKSENQIVILIK